MTLGTVLTTVGLILAYILFWVFAWGRQVGKVNNRLTNLEENTHHSEILPECLALFIEIKENLSELNGKMEVLLVIIKSTSEEHIRSSPGGGRR